MTTRELSLGEAETAVKWLDVRMKKHGCNYSFPCGILPRTGLACYDEQNIFRAVAFLYLEKSSSIAVCGWCIADPDNPARVSAEAVQALIYAMPSFARSKGATILLSTFGNRSINRIAEKAGFIVGEQAVNMYMAL